VLVPSRMGKLAAMYAGVEQETRRLLATFPQRDLEVVVHFFETLEAGRSAVSGSPQPSGGN
jgi:hypothetical protein